MNILNELINLFGEVSPCIIERVNIFEASFQTKGYCIPEQELVMSALAKFPIRDSVKLTLTNEIDDNLVYSNAIASVDPNSINTFYDFVDDTDNIKICIEITKKIVDDTLSVYDFQEFSNFILSKNLLEVLELFNKLFSGRNSICFELLNSQFFFSTNTMVFKSCEIKGVDRSTFLREGRFNSCKQSSRFYNINELHLLPDDFEVIMNCDDNPFTMLFNQIKTIMALVYIADSAYIDNNILSIQILGQRSLSKDISLVSKKLPINEELFNIYKWIYIDGNTADKTAIARNVMSLHCKYTDILCIDEKTFASIQSNFRLYQRNNVNQYIEIKNKLADYILQMVNSISDLIIGLSDKMKNNFIAVITFLFTVILINIVSSAPLDNIFTRDITFLIDLILFGSFGYLFISSKEMDYRTHKLIQAYYSIKDNYKDLLDESDIRLIFKNDELLNMNVDELYKKKQRYIILWITAIILFLILFEFISTDPFLTNLILKMYKTLSHLAELLINTLRNNIQ